LIPFDVTFVDKPEEATPPLRLAKDKGLEDELRAEAEGILAILVRGCREWQSKGLDPPEAVLAATRSYRQEMDLVAQFVEDRCETRGTGGGRGEVKCNLDHLYEAYTQWAQTSGRNPLPKDKFGRELGRLGFEPHKSNSIRWRLGLRLKEPAHASPLSP